MKKEDKIHNKKTFLSIIEADPIRRIIMIVISIILILGAIYLRFHNLGKFGFWGDELYHVIAAQGLIDNERPSFPSGVEYKRALSFTFLVYKSFQIFGINEMAARLPSVVFNILFIFAGYFIVKKWFSRNSAIIFTLIISFSPYMLQITRQSRMYTAFQLFYFFGAYFFWEGFEKYKRIISVEGLKRIEQKFDISIIFLLFSLIMFCISYHFHPLTLNFVFTIGFYVLSVLFLYHSVDFTTEKINSKYGVILSLLIIIAFFILIIHPEFYRTIYKRVTTLPGWKTGELVDVKSFLWVLRVESPIFFFLYPISALYIIKKYNKKGLYVVLNFLVPFLLHSFLLKWKEERFMVYFFPFYVLTVAIFVGDFIKKIWIEFRKFNFNIKIIDKLSPVCFIFSMFIFLYPWFFNSRHMTNYIFWTDWKPSLKYISPLLKKDSKVVTLLDDQSSIYYYIKKVPDYYIAPKTYFEDEENEYKYFNSIPVKTVEDLSSIYKSSYDVWVIARRKEYFNGNRYYRKDIMGYIQENFSEMNSPENKDIIVFRSNKHM